MISTHTLTWSVTDKSYLYFLPRIISTHTLTWSVTNNFLSGYIPMIFQLTRSRGAWLCIAEPYSQLSDFNSHAHVERDLPFLWRSAVCSLYFNSHAHVERDQRNAVWTLPFFNFNSHAHVERDRVTRSTMTLWSYFNSHAHVERDLHLLLGN